MKTTAIKSIKIVLTIVALGVVGFLAWKFIGDDMNDVVEKPSFDPTTFTKKLDRRIDSIKNMPEHRFCRDLYDLTMHDITFYDSQNVLDPEDINNDSTVAVYYKKILLVAYCNKFCAQTKYVFEKTNWENANIDFIREETNNIINAQYMTSGNCYDKLNEIKSVLKERDNVMNFIKKCGYPQTNGSIEVHYDQNHDSQLISKAKNYLNGNELIHKEILNDSEIKRGLEVVNVVTCYRHFNYLKRKVEYWSNRYSAFNKQLDYSNAVYTPLDAQVNAIDNVIYHIDQNDFDQKYNEIRRELNANNDKAYYYYQIADLIREGVAIQQNSNYDRAVENKLDEINGFLLDDEISPIVNELGFDTQLEGMKNELYSDHKQNIQSELSDKIGKYSNYYDIYSYESNIYDPLKKRIDSFKKTWEDMLDVTTDYNNMLNTLDTDRNLARSHYN